MSGLGFPPPAEFGEHRRVDDEDRVVVGFEFEQVVCVDQRLFELSGTDMGVRVQTEGLSVVRVGGEHLIARANRFFEVVESELNRSELKLGRDRKLARFARLLQRPYRSARVPGSRERNAEAVAGFGKLRRFGENFAQSVDRILEVAGVLECTNLGHAIIVGAATTLHQGQQQEPDHSRALHRPIIAAFAGQARSRVAMLEIELHLVEEVGSIPRRMSQYKEGFAYTGSIRRLSGPAELDNENSQKVRFLQFCSC